MPSVVDMYREVSNLIRMCALRWHKWENEMSGSDQMQPPAEKDIRDTRSDDIHTHESESLRCLLTE